MNAPPAPPRLALVGDRSPTVLAHERIPTILAALGTGDPLDAYWLHSGSIDADTDPVSYTHLTLPTILRV